MLGLDNCTGPAIKKHAEDEKGTVVVGVLYCDLHRRLVSLVAVETKSSETHSNDLTKP
jgi:hypothetical protein